MPRASSGAKPRPARRGSAHGATAAAAGRLLVTVRQSDCVPRARHSSRPGAGSSTDIRMESSADARLYGLQIFRGRRGRQLYTSSCGTCLWRLSRVAVTSNVVWIHMDSAAAPDRRASAAGGADSFLLFKLVADRGMHPRRPLTRGPLCGTRPRGVRRGCCAVRT